MNEKKKEFIKRVKRLARKTRDSRREWYQMQFQVPGDDEEEEEYPDTLIILKRIMIKAMFMYIC